MHILSWPKTRHLTDTVGRAWEVSVEPGGLSLVALDGEQASATFINPNELRALAMQIYAAAIDYDGAVQEAAVKASIERRRLRGLGGNRHQPVVDRPEPPMHMEVPA